MTVSGFSYANTTCQGKLNFVSMNPDQGLVQFNYGYGTQYYCKLGEVYNNVPPEACQGVYSMLLAAQMAGKSIEARYNTNFTCSSAELGNEEPLKKLMYRIRIVD